MFKLFRKNGEVFVTVFWGIMALSSIAAISFRGPHIIKRSIEKCVAEGGEDKGCKDKINSWGQSARIKYIRDI